MLSLTAKVCCKRLPLRISTLMTVMFGRVNLGASAEQLLSARLNARGNDTARGNARATDKARARRNKIWGSRGNM
jgi:hypothetical protein